MFPILKYFRQFSIYFTQKYIFNTKINRIITLNLNQINQILYKKIPQIYQIITKLLGAYHANN